DVQCNGGSDGTVTATLGGGTSPYTISIDGGAAASATSPKTFTGLGQGSHSVTVTDAHNCALTKSITVNQPPTALMCSAPTVSGFDGICGHSGVLTEGASGGTPPYSYLWSVTNPPGGNWSLVPGTGANQITFTAGSFASAATFTVIVKDAHNCTSTCFVTIECSPPQVEFCGLTQGFYGNQGGKFGNPQLTANQIMTNLLGAPYGDLTVGKLGQSFTLRQANASSDADCVVKKLPANSTPTTLPAGNGVFTGGCNTSTNIPTGSGGKWQNVLLGQTITLAFNIRYDASLHGGPPNGLGGLTICSTMVTQGSLPGPDGKPGSGDEVIDPSSPLLTVTIPNNVMCALLTIGDHTQ